MEAPKIGDKTKMTWAGIMCPVEEVREMSDGKFKVKVRDIGGLFDWEKVKA